MVHIVEQITFLLNDEVVRTDVSPGTLVLDFVRQRKQLTGTKEGCKEGDCGACTVILGELTEEGLMEYRPMTSCLLPVGELNGKHLVTIEGLNMKELSPVQSAMVECGGTQCGYCTPGFIVAMTSGLMEPKVPLDRDGLLYAISGNLCRCTGYRSIKEAGMKAIDSLTDKLAGKERIKALCEAGALPDYFTRIPERLKEIKPTEGPSISSTTAQQSRLIVAGGTDLYVQRGELIPEMEISLLNTMDSIPPVRLSGETLIVDARMTFETFADDPLIQAYIPEVSEYNLLIASWPVRTRSTLGGNICNASPIADMTCLLLALDTQLLISDGVKERTVPLKNFYTGYKQLAKTEDEIVTQLSFTAPAKGVKINWEKVSKRAWLDIATVNSAARIHVIDDWIQSADLSLGGVAAVPLYLREASAFLTDKPLSSASVESALEIALEEFTPMSDIRGSADYKRLLARQLLWAHFIKLFPEVFSEEAVHAAL